MYSRNTNSYDENDVVSDFEHVSPVNQQQPQAPPVPKPRRDVSSSSNFFDTKNDGFPRRDRNICYLNVNGVKVPYTKIINKNGEEEYIPLDEDQIFDKQPPKNSGTFEERSRRLSYERPDEHIRLQSFEVREQQNLERENALPQHRESSVSPLLNDRRPQNFSENRFETQSPLPNLAGADYVKPQELEEGVRLDEQRKYESQKQRHRVGDYVESQEPKYGERLDEQSQYQPQQRRNVEADQHRDTSASPHQNRRMQRQPKSPEAAEYTHDDREATPVSYSIRSDSLINLPPQEFANLADPDPFIFEEVNANLRRIYQQSTFIQDINHKIDRLSKQISRLEDMKKKLDHVADHVAALLDQPKQLAALSESIYTLKDAINVAAAKSVNAEPKVSAGKANAEISKPAAQRKAEKASLDDFSDRDDTPAMPTRSKTKNTPGNPHEMLDTLSADSDSDDKANNFRPPKSRSNQTKQSDEGDEENVFQRDVRGNLHSVLDDLSDDSDSD